MDEPIAHALFLRSQVTMSAGPQAPSAPGGRFVKGLDRRLLHALRNACQRVRRRDGTATSKRGAKGHLFFPPDDELLTAALDIVSTRCANLLAQ